MGIGIQSRRLRHIPHLASFFPEWQIVPVSWFTHRVRHVDALAGWGHKRPARITRALARRSKLPFIALEDGFVRSYDLAVNGASPWALVADHEGIYYDATQPSELEKWIAEASTHHDSKAAGWLAHLWAAQVSKYNRGPIVAPEKLGVCEPYILLVDQCVGDASVPLGYGSGASFAAMVAEVRQRFPQHQLVVKSHPDVVSGKRNGYLPRVENALVIAQDINPYPLLEKAEEVHVVTSLLGMEALIAGKKVVCHAAPFYAGWGLTQDRALPASVAARRTARPNINQLFDAAYCRYSRYINPLNGERSDLAACIDRIVTLRSHYSTKPERLHAVGFSAWKQPHVTPFLIPPHGQVTFHDDTEKAITAAAADNTPLAMWAAKETSDMAPRCHEKNIPLLRVEDGFIRSAGLGSDLIAAASLVIDPQGIYFDATQPSSLETILENVGIPSNLIERAALLRKKIRDHAISKYNPAEAALPTLPQDKPIHLVVGQVEDDASIARGGCGIRTNAALLEAVRSAHPGAWIIYKPHPDVVAGNRRAGEADRAPIADQIITKGRLASLFPYVEALHTITSLAGFEMLLHGGRVVTYGQPFYAGWGLTEDRGGAMARRTRQRSIDELAAAALILYPDYYDWQARLPTTPEQIIAQLAIAPVATPRLRQATRFARWLRGWL